MGLNGARDRQDLYKKGGLISVTSQIFTVDMLTGDIPTHLITGIIVLHAERCVLDCTMRSVTLTSRSE